MAVCARNSSSVENALDSTEELLSNIENCDTYILLKGFEHFTSIERILWERKYARNE